MTEATVSSVATTTRRVPGGRAKVHRHGLAGFLFTLPFMVLFLAFFIAPLIYAAYLSLYRKQLIGTPVLRSSTRGPSSRDEVSRRR